MNSLPTELQRLYLTSPAERDDAGEVRAIVIELARPSNWKELSRLWYGVQTEFDLPAPAIAVSGTDGLQLWFSVERAVAAADAGAFAAAVCSRFLADVDPRRLTIWPESAASATPTATASASAPAAPGRPLAQRVPALVESTGNWSAFVAPDLAPIFSDTPWLDIAPNLEGQAAILRPLASMKADAMHEVVRRLAPPVKATPSSRDERSHRTESPSTPTAATPAASSSTTPEPVSDAESAARRRAEVFLLDVMDDQNVPLPLRIEAAATLLGRSTRRPRGA